MHIIRTESEIIELIDKTINQQDSKRFCGMTYEEGIRNMFEWLTGNIDDIYE